jgi:hypothetical protein
MAQIEGRDHLGAAIDRGLQHQLVARVGQMRAPQIADLDRRRDPSQRVQQPVDIFDRGAACRTALLALQDRLVLVAAEGVTPEQAVDEAIARIKEILSE